MSYQAVEFRVRCSCGEVLEASWEVPGPAQQADAFEGTTATRCLVIKPCQSCKKKPASPPAAPAWDFEPS